MTKVTVFQKDDYYTRIICEGHAGYGVAGEDIVCSGLSCILNTAAIGLLMVAKANVDIIKDDKKAYLEIVVPANLSPETAHDVQVIMQTTLCGVSDLHSEFSDFIELEVKKC